MQKAYKEMVQPYQNKDLLLRDVIKSSKLGVELLKFFVGCNFKTFKVKDFLEEYRKNPNILDLKANWKEGDEDIDKRIERIKCKDFSDFTIERHFGRGKYIHDSKCNKIYGGTNFQFILCEKGLFSACLGFEFYKKDSILIPQIQGVKGRGKSLESIRWPNALLNLTTEWARKLDLSEIMVLPHDRSFWPIVELNKKGAKMYYDITAKREGFNYDSEKKVFLKKLK